MRFVRHLAWAGLFLLLLPTLRAGADGDLRRILAALSGEKDPARRVALVRKLSSHDTAAAAEQLYGIARADPSAEVRGAAILVLGGLKAPESAEFLGRLAVAGGVHPVRLAVARALAGRPDGETLLFAVLDAPKSSDLARGLAIEALGGFSSASSLNRLTTLATGDDEFLRTEALRALAARRDFGDRLGAVLRRVTGKHRDASTAHVVLDLIERHPDPALMDVVELLATFLDPDVREAADHARAALAYRRAVAAAAAAAAAAAKGGYAPPGGGVPPTPPAPRPRFDIVCGFDTTGSVSGHLESIRKWVKERCRLLRTMGVDLRIGIVAFRDTTVSARKHALTVLPLTFDVAAVDGFLDGLRTGGADSQGAGVKMGLDECLNRMGWRWDASRSVVLVADSRCDDPAGCLRVARIHRVTDGTRVRVLYLLRTRSRVPDDIQRLAEVGGGRVEILE